MFVVVVDSNGKNVPINISRIVLIEDMGDFRRIRIDDGTDGYGVDTYDEPGYLVKLFNEALKS